MKTVTLKRNPHLKNPVRKQEDYPWNPLKRKKRNSILIPLGIGYLLWKWSKPKEKRKMKVYTTKQILDKVVSTLIDKSWSDRRIEAYLLKKSSRNKFNRS